MSGSKPKKARVPKGKTVEEGAGAKMPDAMSPSESEPTHTSWSRLDHLYRITKLLLKFDATLAQRDFDRRDEGPCPGLRLGCRRCARSTAQSSEDSCGQRLCLSYRFGFDPGDECQRDA